jgi:hypothetical protein
MFFKPLNDRRHVFFETAWNVNIEKPHQFIASIFEVVRHPCRDSQECALCRIHPLVTRKECHRAFKYVKNIVVGFMRMCAGPRLVRLKPPLRYGVGVFRFFAVSFENASHSTK